MTAINVAGIADACWLVGICIGIIGWYYSCKLLLCVCHTYILVIGKMNELLLGSSVAGLLTHGHMFQSSISLLLSVHLCASSTHSPTLPYPFMFLLVQTRFLASSPPVRAVFSRPRLYPDGRPGGSGGTRRHARPKFLTRAR